MRSYLIALAALLIGGAEANAKEVDVYHCKLSQTQNLISEEMTFIHDPQL